MQYENVFKRDRCCSYYTCLPQSSPAAQTAVKTVAAPKDQCLLTIAMPKQVQHIHIHANKGKH